MGGQVNVRLGDDDDADLTRCAAERGVERATLAKSFVREWEHLKVCDTDSGKLNR